MKYNVILNSREFEIAVENFDFERFYRQGYDQERKLGLMREAWQANVPLYLHDLGILDPEHLIGKAQTIVTVDPVFSIFDRENLTFAEMVQEIWDRRKKIVKVARGDDNPYE